MSSLSSFFRSTIGAKYLMGLTGIAMVLFALAHMTGNLLMWVGPDAINEYAVGLREMGGGAVLWIARGGLVTVFVLHIVLAIGLRSKISSARPVKYARFRPQVTSYAARTMIVTGVILLAYILFHLGHFTLHAGPYANYAEMVDSAGRHNVYEMVVTGFSNPGVAIFYIVAVFLLAGHLGHGVPSFFQSMGLRHPQYTPTLEKIGTAIAWILFLGFASVPAGVLVGAIQFANT